MAGVRIPSPTAMHVPKSTRIRMTFFLNWCPSNSAEEGRRKVHWLAWGQFIKAKARGGLGFRDLRLFNQALLSRQASSDTTT